MRRDIHILDTTKYGDKKYHLGDPSVRKNTTIDNFQNRLKDDDVVVPARRKKKGKKTRAPSDKNGCRESSTKKEKKGKRSNS